MAAARGGLAEDPAQVLDLGLAADEAREARRAAACSRVRAVPAPVNSKISIGSGRPFTGMGPSDLTST